MLEEWIRCPICGSKTRDRIREDTVLKNYPLYCPNCKQPLGSLPAGIKILWKRRSYALKWQRRFFSFCYIFPVFSRGNPIFFPENFIKMRTVRKAKLYFYGGYGFACVCQKGCSFF